MPYLLFLLPLLFAAFAVKTNYYPLKAGVTLSCMGIILYSGLTHEAFGQESWLILMAFLLSIAGDFFLSNRSKHDGERENWFVYGIGLFLLAHIFYLAFVAGNSRFPVILFFSLLLFLGFYYFLRLKSHIRDAVLKAAVFFYMLISCLSFSLAWGNGNGTAGNLFFILGIGLIVFSDLCIAEYEFIGVESLKKLILPTYYGAHIIISLGLVIH